VFDLAVISVVKWLLLSLAIIIGEDQALRRVKTTEPFKRTATAMACLMASAVLTFNVVKGGLILKRYLTKADRLSVECYAAVITTVTLSLVEFALVVTVLRQGARIKTIALKRIINSDGKEVDTKGNPIVKAVKLSRLLGLAKPVSIALHKPVFSIGKSLMGP